MTMKDPTKEPQEIEALLPWHAAGTLSRKDAARVDLALSEDADFARQFSLIREEVDETIRLNEKLGAPSPHAMEKLMAAVDAEPARRKSLSINPGRWLALRLSSLSPRTLAWSAAAGALAIALQAGLLLGVFVSEREATFQTASAPQQTAPLQGTYAMIAFAPQATAAEITRFLDTNRLSLVEGPRAGGLFRVRLAETKLPQDEVSRILKRLQDQANIIRFAAPVE